MTEPMTREQVGQNKPTPHRLLVAAELELMKTGGIIEVAVRNPNVAEYMRHWEDRATKAETALAAMTERNKALMGALADLDKAASEVARLGAVPGSQWSRLTVASLRARAALRANAMDASEGER